VHKAVIILTKAEDKEEARKKVFDFMSSQVGKVCDWFVIGGRWSGIFTAEKLDRTKLRKVNEEFERKYGWYVDKNNSEEDRFKQYCEIFYKYFPDFKGTPPAWRNVYLFIGYPDDVAPLKEVMGLVKRWLQSIEDTIKEYQKDLRDDNLKYLHDFIKRRIAELQAQVFCDDTNVFNLERGDYSIPDDPEGWYAVIVDMHV